MSTQDFTPTQLQDITFGIGQQKRAYSRKAADLLALVKGATTLTDIPVHVLRDLGPTKALAETFDGIAERIEVAYEDETEVKLQKVLKSTRHSALSTMMWETDLDKLAVARAVAEVFRDADAL